MRHHILLALSSLYLAHGALSVPEPPQSPPKEACQKPTATVPIFRAYRGDVRDHFYTTSSGEFASFKRKGYTDEGITGRVPRDKAPNSTSLYRLYHPGKRDHFYTTDIEERDNAISRLGYKSEGILGYVYKPSSTKPFCPCPEVRALYRMYNYGALDHFYTMDAAEKANATGKLGYSDEGIPACIYPAK